MQGKAGELSFSIIIPTFERREVVVASVRALAGQTFAGACEVIVVVDGSTDGTADALRSLDLPIALSVIEQANLGAASARNRGAAAAAGEILLFLDDDMEADPELLNQHAASHAAGADAVLGHIPLHPDSPRSFLADAIAEWADNRPAAIAAAGEIGLFELLSGHISIRKAVFERLGGFDCAFTSGGTYGDEDLDFGWRLLKGGYRVEFNPAAISRQRYIVGFSQHLQQWRQAGQANVALTRKHPELAAKLLDLNHAEAPHIRLVVRPFARLPLLGSAAARVGQAAAAAVARRWPNTRFSRRIFFLARDLAYWRGIAEGGGIRTGNGLRVLAYHSVSRRPGSGGLADYVIDPESFAAQIDLLLRRGFAFVSADQAEAFLRGHGVLPPRAVLLTFDDGYADLLEDIAPLLKRRGIPALVFVVTAMLGQTNDWDQGTEARPRRLMSVDELRSAEAQGIAVAAHSRRHRALEGLSEADLRQEIDGSLDDLQALGLNPQRLFCYPYGALDDAAEERLQAAGAGAGFTVRAGIARPDTNPLRIPRIEILKRDGNGLHFLWKVASGGRRVPGPRSLLRRLTRSAARKPSAATATSG